MYSRHSFLLTDPVIKAFQVPYVILYGSNFCRLCLVYCNKGSSSGSTNMAYLIQVTL